MERISLSKNPPILKVRDNVLLSNNGDVVLGFALDLPEIFTLSKEDYEAMHDFWFRALRFLPKYSFVHKQDIFLKQSYTGEELPTQTFLQKATSKHFKGRTYFNHYPLLFIGNRGKSFLKNPSLSNPFKALPRKERIVKEFERDRIFEREVHKCIDFLNTSRFIKAVPLSEEKINTLQEDYYNGFYSDSYVDTDLEDKTASGVNCITVGNKIVGAYSLNDIQQFPEYIDVFKLDYQYSSKKFEFFKGLADDFGFRLPYNHIYNQIIYLDDHSAKKSALKEQGRKLKGAKGFDIENQQAGEDVDKYLVELSQDAQKILVQGHTNIIYYAESPAEFEACTRAIETLFKAHDFKAKYPKREALKELYLNSFPAFSGGIGAARMYDTELQICLATFLNVSTYKSDEEGVIFSDRVYNIPIKRDVRDALKKRIKAWNFSIYAPTGEGKSVLAQHIFRQFNEFGYKNVIFDIGGSFKKLALLLPKEKSQFFSFEPGKPLGLNPFYIEPGADVSIEKYNDLAAFVFKAWQPESDITPDSVTALVRIIKAYYQSGVSTPSFPGFYSFVYDNKESLLEQLEIDSRFFDLKKFLFSCSKYVGEGSYAFLFEDCEDQSSLIKEKDYVVFEFDKAQDDPTALAMLMLLGSQAVKSLIWNDKGTPGVIFFDELAKFIKYKSIRDTVVFFYQAIRKQNASVGSALQSPAQLPVGDDTNAMIDNTQVLYVLYNEKGYQPLVDRFSLSEHQHNILKSLISINHGEKNYVEFALIIGKDIWPLRLELPKEALKVYQTEGAEYQAIMNTYKQTQNMEEAIKLHIEHY